MFRSDLNLIVFVIVLFTAVPTSSEWFNTWSDFLDWNWFFGSADLNPLEDFEHRFSNTLDSEEVNYLANLITKAEQNGFTYQFPTSAHEYATDKNNTIGFGLFDFIVVGAGSGGTVIASRLSEIYNWKVLLLDAGDFGDHLTDIPNMYFPVEFTKYNWGYTSTPQKTSCLGMENRMCAMPRGKGIGGTTLINGLVYSRGSSIDFNKWAKLVNDSRWSYENVLYYFKKSEDFEHRDKTAPVYDTVHGEHGLLHVEYHLPRSPQLNAFLDANIELGLPIADYNAGTGLGASPAQINTKFGKRFDGGKAFIHPFLKRPNLKVLTNSYVTKILLNNKTKTAYGVEFTHNGNRYIATVKKEVILSAGSIATPHIMMLSGIGPKYHLEAFKIPVYQDLAVGTSLKDHPCFYGLNFGTSYTEPIESIQSYVEQYLNGIGPLAAPGNNQGVGFYESQFTKDTGYPDIEIMFIPANATASLSQRAFRFTNTTYDEIWRDINRSQTYIMYVTALHAESTGSIRLKSNDPFDYPVINTNFLSDSRSKDIRTIYEGIQHALKLSNTKSLKNINAKLQGKPLSACRQYVYLSKAYWYCAIRQLTMNLYHPVGTCPMGQSPDKGAVVDSALKVFGIKNLRIGDASVFPFTLAGHPNAAVVLVGEILSDILKEEYIYGINFK